ncbi:MAG: tetratricopeptide repeat protein [Fimbriimonadales bacterium]|nr:tetratricopeptide repeat protein [Fimbriimonadales bacterium]
MTTDKLLARAETALIERDVETLRQCARRLHMARHPDAYYYEASAYELEDRIEEAIEVLRRGIRARPRDEELRVDLIELLERHERTEEALQVCEEGIQSLTGVAQFALHAHKIRLLSRMERYHEGIATIDAALQLPPPAYRPSAERMLEPIRMELLIKLKDFDAARESLRRIETMLQQEDDPFLEAYLYAGQAQLAREEEGDIPKARAFAEKALQVERTQPAAISIYYETGEPVPEPVRLYGIELVSQVAADNEEPQTRVTVYMIAARSEEEARAIALDYERDAIPGATQILRVIVAEDEVKQNVPVGIVRISEDFPNQEELYP